MKRSQCRQLSDRQMESVCGGAPSGLRYSPVASRGVILTVGIALPTINVSIVVIANAVINNPLTINVGQGVHRL